MSQMQPRQLGTPSMTSRVSTFSQMHNYAYAEAGVKYEQSLVTYEYFDSRGNLAPRTVNGATMKGR